MSADLLWAPAGGAITAEQQLIRYAMALEETHNAKRLNLDNFNPVSQDFFVTVSQGTYQFATGANKKHFIVVATIPMALNAGQFARKPWMNAVELGSEQIAAAYGTA